MTRCRRYGKIRSFIITKSNRRATLSACATLVWPPPTNIGIRGHKVRTTGGVGDHCSQYIHVGRGGKSARRDD